MDDSLPHALGRIDWGFGNPNKTATLIALIMVGVWVLAYVRKWGFWIALPLLSGFGICLILTQSRGGLVGLLIGSLIALVWAPRPFSWKRSAAVLIACASLTIFAFFMKADTRYAQGLEKDDRSIDNRLLIWRAVPAMIHAAPNGWGIGRSGDAYMQWFQPINRSEGYRTLVNSHLTWLVELDWPGRIVYVFGWTAIFTLLWPRSDTRWFSIPFAIWVTLFICASFSSVAEARSLWIIPILALMGVLLMRFKQRLWPKTDVWLIGTFVSSTLLVLIWLLGVLVVPQSTVHCPRPGIVTLGSTSPTLWIVAPNRNIVGEHYGHEVRRAYDANPIYHQTGIGIVTQLKNAPANQTLVFSSQVPSTLNTLHNQKIICSVEKLGHA
jgi:hypothetical protein